MASQVGVANAALAKLGTWSIASIDGSSSEAVAVRSAWERIRDAELRAHPWKFALQRGVVGRETAVPAWGYAYQFRLPAGFLRLVEIDGAWAWACEDKAAWSVEAGRLLTDRAGPVNLRWVGSTAAVAQWDPLFVEAMACRLAAELCETLTGQTAKRQQLDIDYATAVRTARQVDAIERAPTPLRDGSWITGRA